MGASSKKKGQQRKAAKKALSAAATAGSGSGVNSGDGSNLKVVGGNSNHSKIVAKVRRGNNYATKRLNSGVEEGFSYEDSGVLSVVLEFLNRCEDETFEGVMNNVGGDLKSPSLWVNIIKSASFVEPSCRLQIVENIGPLARCMCDDVKRLFFKSNKHWVESVRLFVHLVGNVMMESKLNNFWEKIVDTLLQYEGLLSSIVQWSFLGEEYRPDIIKELKYEGLADDCINIISISRSILNLLVSDETGLFQAEESRIRLLKTLGTTPIINKSYDPSCTVSYTAGLMRRLKTAADQRDNILQILQCLISEADCVDKVVIFELIYLGKKCTSNDYVTALDVAALFSRCMDPQDTDEPSATRTAFAIRVGLIEMCLGFIKQFVEHKCFGDNNGCFPPMYTAVERILKNVSKVSLHKKPARAIRSKKDTIESKLLYPTTQRFYLNKRRELENKDISNNIKRARDLLDMVRSILDISGRFCCRCNKSLSKTEVMECNGCHRMAYCSKSCQKEDWLNGHKLACCCSYTEEVAGQFQGRVMPSTEPDNERAAAKMKELEKNMNMAQQKLFLDHSDTILSQAKALDLPLHDCVVEFDLCKCPPIIKVEDYRKGFTGEERKGFEETRSKENITCIYHSHIINGESDLCMQRLFPLEWLSKVTTVYTFHLSSMKKI